MPRLKHPIKIGMGKYYRVLFEIMPSHNDYSKL